ncbi:hypothetical protein Drorol1_Dr00002572 [Drosera rotundifolia]
MADPIPIADTNSIPITDSPVAPTLPRATSFSKLNATAPEFVPSPRGSDSMIVITPAPASVQIQNVQIQQQHNQEQKRGQRNHPGKKHKNQNQMSGGGGGEEDGAGRAKAGSDEDHRGSSSAGLTEEAAQKIINQVEFYFSDVNLATTDHLIRFIHKNPDGFVPISVVASFKKIKALISTDSQLAAVLRNSKKLVVSDDGRKVKRLYPLTASDMEELQARIIIAENLPEDHCHQKLMKIFSSVGSVKSIRTCQSQPLNNGGPAVSRPLKQDNMLYSNKLHAFVEYDSVELAEKAVVELNEEGNWRNGLRVRLILKRKSKSVLARGKKVVKEGEETCEEDGTPLSEQSQGEKHAEDSSRQPDFHSHENLGEDQVVEKEGGQKKNRNRGRGARGRGRGHQHPYNHGGAHIGTLGNNSSNMEPASGIIKHHHPPGPRMPDGTRGFSMGRGKPLLVNTA